MKLGIKVGPEQQSIDNLSATNPAMCEVWFNANRTATYDHLFDELSKRTIDVGLHFWGKLPDGTSPNLAYPDTKSLAATVQIMKQTIDVAAKHHFSYVNIHPGACTKYTMAFDTDPAWTVLSEPVDIDVCIATFLEHAIILTNYAKTRGVTFTVETVPQRVAWDFKGYQRDKPMNIHELPGEAIYAAARHGIAVANDFGHTAAIPSDDPQTMYQRLTHVTTDLAPYTRLIHLGYVIPPYNGTDYHDHLDNPLLNTNAAIPNTQKMIELLKLFQNRSDVWALVEPRDDHVKNYFLAQALLDHINTL